MGIIVLAETKQARVLPSGAYVARGGIAAVHAAPSDPTVSEDPTDRTLCRRETCGMDNLHHRPKTPGEPWYPQNLEKWVCRVCDQALRRR